MKILIATGIYPPDIGGPATYSKLLFDELPKRGIEVKVVSFGEVRKYVKVVRHFVYLFKLINLAKTADLILAVDTVSAAFPALLASKLTGRNFFVRVPGDYAWEQSVQRFHVKDSIDDFQNKKYGFKVEFLRKIQKIVVNGAKKVIVPSLYFQRIVSKWVNNPEKVICIYNGIDLSEIPESIGNYEPKTLISAGRLVPWKGFASLIKMMTKLPDWKLAIVGDGPDKSKLEALIKSENLSDRVTLLGQIPRKELIRKIQASEIFVLNTSFESFSFQVVEAMAAGTPVITTDIGNLSEIIDTNMSGILVRPDDEQAMIDSIHRLEEKNLRKEIIRNGREKAKQFSIQETLNKLVSCIK